MRNETPWHPTKYVQRGGRWRTSLDSIGELPRAASDLV